MLGLSVHSKVRFAGLFAPAFPRLRGKSWIAPCDVFVMPDAWIERSRYDETGEICVEGPVWEFERDVRLVGSRRRIYASELGYYCSVDLLPKYAPAVSEDWAALFALEPPVGDPSAWLEAYHGAENRAAFVATNAHSCFLTVDGAFWSFFSHDDALLEQVRAHLAGQPDTDVRPGRLDDYAL